MKNKNVKIGYSQNMGHYRLRYMHVTSPFIFMKIGPLGKKHCGFGVPDIYILGMDIIGKDKSFDAINFAYKFQFGCIVLFILSTLMLNVRLIQNRSIVFFKRLNATLLVLFPIWIWFYSDIVESNSDCATLDLQVRPQIGFLFSGLVLLLTVALFRQLKRN
jgi:hypothetical protein